MKDLVKNPIGIIALFISLIYGFANLLLGTTASSLTSSERYPLVMFIVLFPVVVLGIFYLLVSRHHGKLYAPGDYKDDKSFLRTLSREEREQKIDREVEESMPVTPEASAQQAERPAPTTPIHRASVSSYALREEFRQIEDIVIAKYERELNVKADRDVVVGETGASFDALLVGGQPFSFLEVKIIKSPMVSIGLIDRLLYSAMLADKYLNGRMKLHIAVVYEFEKEQLEQVESVWRPRVEKCPVNIDLRFISRGDVNA